MTSVRHPGPAALVLVPRSGEQAMDRRFDRNASAGAWQLSFSLLRCCFFATDQMGWRTVATVPVASVTDSVALVAARGTRTRSPLAVLPSEKRQRQASAGRLPPRTSPTRNDPEREIAGFSAGWMRTGSD